MESTLQSRLSSLVGGLKGLRILVLLSLMVCCLPSLYAADAMVNFITPESSYQEADTTVQVRLLAQLTTPGVVLNYPVTIGFSVAGTAAAGADFQSLPLDVTISDNGEVFVEGALPVTLLDDLDQEGNETIVLTLIGDESVLAGPNNTHVLTIRDDDTPEVSFTRSALTAGEADGTVMVTVALAQAADAPLTVYYEVGVPVSEFDKIATPGLDYNVLTGSVLFPVGQTTAQIAITILDDEVEELIPERVELRLIEAVDGVPGTTALYNVGTSKAFTLIIQDNEPPTVSFQQSEEVRCKESAGEVTVAVRLSRAGEEAISVSFTASGSATEGGDNSDYTIEAGKTVEFPAGTTEQLITLTIVDDTEFESEEDVVLSLQKPGNAGLGAIIERSVKIVDNEKAVVEFDEIEGTLPEDFGVRSVALRLSEIPQEDVTVTVELGGTATKGDDYWELHSEQIVFLAGMGTQFIALNIIDDDQREEKETITVTVKSAPSNINIGVQNRYTVTITDNDQYSAVQISPKGFYASDPDQNASTPDVAIDAAGNAHIIWKANNALWYAMMNDRNEIVYPAREVYAPSVTAVLVPRVAVGRDGTVHVVHMTTSRDNLNYVRIKNGQYVRSSAFQIYPRTKYPTMLNQTYAWPDIAVNALGRAIVVAEGRVSDNAAIPNGRDFIATIEIDEAGKADMGKVWAPFQRHFGVGAGNWPFDGAARPTIVFDYAGNGEGYLHVAWRHKEVAKYAKDNKAWAGWGIAHAVRQFNSIAENNKWTEVTEAKNRNVLTYYGGPSITGVGNGLGADIVWSDNNSMMFWQRMSAGGERVNPVGVTGSLRNIALRSGTRWPEVAGGFDKTYFGWMDNRHGAEQVYGSDSANTSFTQSISGEAAGSSFVRMAARAGNSADYVWKSGAPIFYRSLRSGISIEAQVGYDRHAGKLNLTAHAYDTNQQEITGKKAQEFTWVLKDGASKTLAQGKMVYSANKGAWAGEHVFPTAAPLLPGTYTVTYDVAYAPNAGLIIRGQASSRLTITKPFGIKGVVLDEKGAKMPGVTVAVRLEPNLPSIVETTTDSSGNYEFKDLVASQVKFLTAEKLNYNKIFKEIDAPSDGKQLVMEPLNMSLYTDGPKIVSSTLQFGGTGVILAGLGNYTNTLKMGIVWNNATPKSVEFFSSDTNESLKLDNIEKDKIVTLTFDVSKWFKAMVLSGYHIRVVATDTEGRTNEQKVKINVIPIPELFVTIFSTLPKLPTPLQPVLKYEYTMVEIRGVNTLPFLGKLGPDVTLKLGALFKLADGEWNVYVNGNPGEEWQKEFEAAGKDDDKEKIKLYFGEKELEITPTLEFKGKATPNTGVTFEEAKMGMTLEFSGTVLEVLLADAIGGSFVRLLDSLKKWDFDVNSFQRIVLKAAMKASGEALLQVTKPVSTKKLTLEMEPSLKAVYNPNVAGLSAELTVGGSGSVKTQILPKPGLEEVTLKAVLEALFKVGSIEAFKGSYAVLDWKYPKPPASGVVAAAASSGLGSYQVRPVSRSYLQYGPSRFLSGGGDDGMVSGRSLASSALSEFRTLSEMEQGEPVMMAANDVSASALAQADLTLISNVYPDSKASLAAHGSELMLVYAADNGGADMQFTDIHWTWFDGTNWTAPAAIKNDTRAEFSPSVTFDGLGNAVAVWERIKDTNFTTVDLDAMLAQYEVVWSRWDRGTKTWSEPVELSNNAFLDHSPLICGPMSDGGLIAVWTSNESNLFVGSGAAGAITNSTVFSSRYNAGSASWTVPVAVVSDLTGRYSQSLAGQGGTALYTWTCDVDMASGDEVQDTELYTALWSGTAWGAPVRQTDDDVADAAVRAAVSATGTTYLVWRSGTNLVMNQDMVTSRSLVRVDSDSLGFMDFSLAVGLDGNLAMVWQEQVDEDGADAWYSIYDPASHGWSQDQRLFDDSNLKYGFSSAWDAVGNLSVAYSRSALTLETRTIDLEDGGSITVDNMPVRGQTDLGVVKHSLIKDVAVLEGELTYDAASYLPGQVVRFKVLARNVGDLAARDVVVALYDGNPQAGGVEVAREVIAGWMNGATSRTVTLEWTLPEEEPVAGSSGAHTVYAMIDADQAVTEYNEYNNMQWVTIGGTDLSPIELVSATVQADGSARIVARIENSSGPETVPSVVGLRLKGVGGAPLVSVPLPSLAAGNRAEVPFDLPVGTVPLGTSAVYTITTDETGVLLDVNPANNSLDVPLDNEGERALPVAPTFEVIPSSVAVRENGTYDIQIRPTEEPAADITVTIERVSGDTDLTVVVGAEGSPQTLPKAAWDTPKTVRLAAADDVDTVGDTAVFRIHETTANGFEDFTFTVEELENDNLIEVGGNIAIDTVWDNTTRDYKITSTISVAAGMTLTIAPGVTVRHEGSSLRAIQVSGTLVANGVTFMLETNGYYWGRRDGIQVLSGGLAQLTNCDLRIWEVNSGVSVNDWASGVHVENGGSAEIRGCSFESVGPLYRSQYGASTDAQGFLLISDDASTTPAKMTSFRGFTSGINWILGGVDQQIDVCEFVNCGRSYYIRGTLTTTATLKNKNGVVVYDATVGDGATMVLVPGAELGAAATDRYLRISAGGTLRADSAKFIEYMRDIRVYGNFIATDTDMQFRTYGYYWDRRDGIHVFSGGSLDLTRCSIQTYEERPETGGNNWAAGIYCAAGGSMSVKGCSFENLEAIGTTLYGIVQDTGVMASFVGDDPDTGSFSSFSKFPCGVHFNTMNGNVQTIERCSFSDCTHKVEIYGNLTGNIVLPNEGQWVVSATTLKNGATLHLPEGSEWNSNVVSTSHKFTIENGAAMTADGSNWWTTMPTNVSGSLVVTSSTISNQTFSQWDPLHGFDLLNGGRATFRECSFTATETSRLGGGGEYTAIIRAQAGSQLVADRCFFTSLDMGKGPVRYSIISLTENTLKVTDCAFINGYVGMEVRAIPATRLITGNDFSGNTDYAMYNTTATRIDALNCWWGSPTGPRHITNPGGSGDRVSDNVNFGSMALKPSFPIVTFADPTAGQVTNSLTEDAVQNAVELIGFRVTPVSSQVRSVGFALSAAEGGFTWDQLSNYRLMIDENGDGQISGAETTQEGGTPTVSADGSKIVFDSPFESISFANAAYVLVANLADLAVGDRFTISLAGQFMGSSYDKGVALTVSPVRHSVGGAVILTNHPAGQVGDGLGALAIQKDVALFAFNLNGTGETVEVLTFDLTNISGVNTAKLINPRLYVDSNYNGRMDEGEATVAGAGAVAISSVGTITFNGLFASGKAHILVADLQYLSGGDRFTVNLAPAKVDLIGAETVSGLATPVTHLADYPMLLAKSDKWEAPSYFGVSPTQPNLPIMGFRLSPMGRMVDSMTVNLFNAVGIVAEDISNVQLFWDANSDGVINAGDELVLANPIITLDGDVGSIYFDAPFVTRGDMIITANFTNLVNREEITIALEPGGLVLPNGDPVSGSVPEVRLVAGKGLPDNFNANMKWTLTYRSPGGTKVSGRFNHKGDRVILGYDTGSAWVYDTESNTPLFMLKDHYDKVRYAGFSSDDSAAVTVSRDGAVYIWDLNTSGSLRSSMFADLLVTYAVPSPDFRKLMVITEGKGLLMDIDTERRLWEFIPGNATVNAIAYSPNGDMIAIGASDNRAYLVDAQTGVTLGAAFLGHSQAVTAVGFTGDGGHLMTASTDATVQLWNISSRQVVRTIALQDQSAQGATVSKDGSRICMITGSSTNAQLRMFNEAGLELYGVNLTNESGSHWRGALENVVFDDAGKRVIVTSSWDSNGWGDASCFRVDDGSYIRSWGPTGRISGGHYARPRISQDGDKVFYHTDWGMNLLSRTEGKTIHRSPTLTGANGYDINRDGSKVAWVQWSGDHNMNIESVSDEGFSTLLSVYPGMNSRTEISMSNDGTKVSLGDRLYSASNGTLLANYASPDGNYVGAFNGDDSLWGFALAGSKSLVTCRTDDPNATLYNLTDTTPYTPYKMFYHPDGKRIAMTDAGTGVQMYDMETQLPVGLYRFVGTNYDTALSDDGSLLLIGGDNTVRLYEVKTGRILRYFYPMHSSLLDVRVRSVQFARDDTLIMIGWSYNYIETYERSRANRLDVSPQTRTLATGQSQDFLIEVVYDDTTRRDITPTDDEDATSVTIEIDPPTAATLVGNKVTVNPGAPENFVVRARFRENDVNYVGEALITVAEGGASLVKLIPDPAHRVVNPGVFRRINYTAEFSDGYQTNVSADVTLEADRPEDVVIEGQSVKVNFTARPGDILITGTYQPSIGDPISTTTVISLFGPKTAWERYHVTGGGYGLSGAFRSDGKQLAIGSSSGAINFYNVGLTPTQYELTHVVMAHDGQVPFLAYLNSTSIVTVGDDGTIKTWAADTPTSVPLSVYAHDAGVTAAALFPPSSLAFGDSLGRVGMMNLANNEITWLSEMHDGKVNSVALDGDTVLSGGADNRIKVIDRTTGVLIRNLNVHTKPVTSVGFLGTNGFFSAGEDATLTRWRKSDYEVVERYEYDAPASLAQVVGNQLFVATNNPPATWIYNMDGLLLRWLEHPPAEGRIVHYMVDPSGAYIITGRDTGRKVVSTEFMGEDMGEEEKISPFSSFQFWEIGRGIYRGSLAHSFPMSDAYINNDGTKIFTQDPKRTMSWVVDTNSVEVAANRLMETGYFIAPYFTSMDFTADSSILATRVGVSIFMYDTQNDLLWKTLHTPGTPFALSPLGTRLATADSRTRLWDLSNLSMIREESRLVTALDFRGETHFLGGIHDDRFIGIWNENGLMFNGVTTLHMPVALFVNREGSRVVVVTEELEEDFFETTHIYFMETYDIADLSKEPMLVRSMYVLSETTEGGSMSGGSSSEGMSFSLAISEDDTLALIGPERSGLHVPPQPVLLINMNDGSTIREFLPPTGMTDGNLGAASVGFANNDEIIMIGWREGYASLYRRVMAGSLDVFLLFEGQGEPSFPAPGGAYSSSGYAAAASAAAYTIKVSPGDHLDGRGFVNYANGSRLNVSSTIEFFADPAGLITIDGLNIDINEDAPTPSQVTLMARYQELDDTLIETEILLNIVDAVPPVIKPIADHTIVSGVVYIGPTPELLQGADPISWSIVAGPSSMTINTLTGVVTWPEPSMDATPASVTIRATNALGLDDESFLLTIWGQDLPNALDTVDVLPIVWETSGQDLWHYQTADTHDGMDAARSGILGNYQSSVLSTVVSGEFRQSLTYWHRVVTENGQARLKFKIDNVEQYNIGRQEDWQEMKYELPPGEHTLMWEFSTPWGTTVNDGAWVDQVSLVSSLLPDLPTSPSTTVVRLSDKITMAFGWADAARAETYDIWIWPYYEQKPTTATAWGLTDITFERLLNYSTRYKWQVVARNASGFTAGPEWDLQTESLSKPDEPLDPSPYDGATTATVDILFNWGDSARAFTYEVFLWKEGASVPWQATTTGLTLSQWVRPDDLEYATQYNWKVRARNSYYSTDSQTWTFRTIAIPPPAPATPSPFDGSTTVPIGVVFDWGDAFLATSYDIKVWKTANPMPDAFTFEGLTTSEYDASEDLEYSTEYSWQVTSRNEAGSATGPVWTFYSMIGEPGAPEPFNHATSMYVDTFLDWTDAPGATSYDLYFWIDGTSKPETPYAENLLESYFIPPAGLEFDTAYQWQVVAKNDVSETASQDWAFTTQIAGSPDPALAPFPASGATGVSITSILDWEDTARANGYRLYFWSEGQSRPTWYSGSPWYSEYNPGEMAYNKTYYWQISSYNNTGDCLSNVWSFKTQIFGSPEEPLSPAPYNNETDVAVSVDLAWGEVDSALYYEVFLWKLGDPQPETPIATNLTVNQYNLPLDLNGSTTYKWIVVVYNNIGSTSSRVWTFSTKAAAPPAAPSLPAPSDGATDVAVSTTLDWADSENATAYDVYLWKSSDIKPTVATAAGLGESTFDPPTHLEGFTGYSWQVVAHNSAATADGPIWSFTTAEAVLPGEPTSPSPVVGANNIPAGVLLNWGDATEAETYEIYLWKGSDSKPLVATADGLADSQWRPAALESNTLYYWQVVARNGIGIRVGEVWSFTTARLYTDTQPPIIFAGPYVKAITNRSAVVEWVTNEQATTILDYGLANPPDLTVTVEGTRARHEVHLTNLSPMSVYYIRAYSADTAGNGPAVSAMVSFETKLDPDVASPHILLGPIVTQITNTTAVVFWTTDEPATSRVNYGETETLDKIGAVAGMALEHSVLLTGLTPQTQYYLQTSSTDDVANGPTLSRLLTFRTGVSSDTQAPVFISGPVVVDVSDSAATVLWVTDEPATGDVFYDDGTSFSVVYNPRYERVHAVRLSGLTSATVYNFTVASLDASGNGPAESAAQSFLTRSLADTTAPVIMDGPVADKVTHNSVLVRWETNERSDSVLEIGQTTATLMQATADTGLVREHVLIAASLLPDTRYVYQVSSTDAAGNGPAFSSVGAFRTLPAPDTTRPIILVGPLLVKKTDMTAVLYWKTDEPSDTVVDYGEGLALARRYSAEAMVTEHYVVLTGLLPGQAYSYVASSTDTSGNTVTSDDEVAISSRAIGNFVTDLSPDATAPTIIEAPQVVSVSDSTALIRWVTDEQSDSRVSFGKEGDLSLTENDIEMVTEHLVLLSGLDALSNYSFQIGSVDLSGNGSAPWATQFFATTAVPDNTPPSITGSPSAAIVSDRAAISWATDEFASSVVEYGFSLSDLRHTGSAVGLTQTHVVTLTNLSYNTTYTCKVVSQDVAGNRVTRDFDFFVAPPVFYEINVMAQGDGSVQITPSQATYIENSLVSLRAFPGVGSVFAGWTGDVATENALDNPLAVTMDSDKNLVANFVTNQVQPPAVVHASDGALVGQINVTWDTTIGGNFFRVYRSTSPSGPPVMVTAGWITGHEYVDTNVEPLLTYYYWVDAAVNNTGLMTSILSEHDSGWANTAEAGLLKSYKVTYKGCEVTYDTAWNLQITGSNEKSSIKIALLKKLPKSTADVPGKFLYLLDCPAIPGVLIEGHFGKFYTDAPVKRLKAFGGVKSIGTKNVAIEEISVYGLGAVKMTAAVNSTDQANPLYANTFIESVGPSTLKAKVALNGIFLQYFSVPEQSIKSVKVAAKKAKDSITKASFASYSGIAGTIDALEIRAISAKGGSITPSTLTTYFSEAAMKITAATGVFKVGARGATVIRVREGNISGFFLLSSSKLTVAASGGSITGDGIITTDGISALSAKDKVVRVGAMREYFGGFLGEYLGWAGALGYYTTFVSGANMSAAQKDIKKATGTRGIRGNFYAGAYVNLAGTTPTIFANLEGLIKKMVTGKVGKYPENPQMLGEGWSSAPIKYSGDHREFFEHNSFN